MMVALDLFSARDFSSVTIKKISKAAGVNSALIYYYFRNKEDLYQQAVEYAIRQALDNYARLREKHSNPVDLINDWFENNVQLSAPIRKLVKIMLDHSTAPVRLRSVEALIRKFYKEEMSILSSSVRDGIARGLFRPVDPARTALFASIHLDGIMVAAMVRKGLALDSAVADLGRRFWEHVGYELGAAAMAKRPDALPGSHV
jgi:AcrR family transcriptional regulator